jgi:hypothetical protein
MLTVFLLRAVTLCVALCDTIEAPSAQLQRSPTLKNNYPSGFL